MRTLISLRPTVFVPSEAPQAEIAMRALLATETMRIEEALRIALRWETPTRQRPKDSAAA